ncbi:MAG: hypothetical protein ABWW70_06635 [Thermoproteota archaeon]
MSPSRCLADEATYRVCTYYQDPQERRERKSIIDITSKPSLVQSLRPYAPIHLLSEKPPSKCTHMEIYSYSGGYLAFCKVLGRLLTRSEAKLCAPFYQTCPLYRFQARRSEAASYS